MFYSQRKRDAKIEQYQENHDIAKTTKEFTLYIFKFEFDSVKQFNKQFFFIAKYTAIKYYSSKIIRLHEIKGDI